MILSLIVYACFSSSMHVSIILYFHRPPMDLFSYFITYPCLYYSLLLSPIHVSILLIFLFTSHLSYSLKPHTQHLHHQYLLSLILLYSIYTPLLLFTLYYFSLALKVTILIFFLFSFSSLKSNKS